MHHIEDSHDYSCDGGTLESVVCESRLWRCRRSFLPQLVLQIDELVDRGRVHLK
jgi:hypothetical protein